MNENRIGASKRTRRRMNRRYGDLVKLAAQISGRAHSTIYGVLNGRITSDPVERAIDTAREQLLRSRRPAA